MTPGDRIGPYEVVGLVGSGGMGEVYRAHDSKLNRDVAIKILPEALAADPIALARFEREAQAVAALSHPNILAIFDFGRQGDTATPSWNSSRVRRCALDSPTARSPPARPPTSPHRLPKVWRRRTRKGSCTAT